MEKRWWKTATTGITCITGCIMRTIRYSVYSDILSLLFPWTKDLFTGLQYVCNSVFPKALLFVDVKLHLTNNNNQKQPWHINNLFWHINRLIFNTVVGLTELGKLVKKNFFYTLWDLANLTTESQLSILLCSGSKHVYNYIYIWKMLVSRAAYSSDQYSWLNQDHRTEISGGNQIIADLG